MSIRAKFRCLLVLLALLGLMCSASAQNQINGVTAHAAGPATLTAQFSSTCVNGTTCVELLLGGYAGVSVQVTGTWAGTLTFQSTVDGTTWVNTSLIPAASSTPTATTTGNGLWSGSIVAQKFRVQFTTRSSGSAVVTIRSTIVTARTGGDGGNPFDQSLNTTDSPTFDNPTFNNLEVGSGLPGAGQLFVSQNGATLGSGNSTNGSGTGNAIIHTGSESDVMIPASTGLIEVSTGDAADGSSGNITLTTGTATTDRGYVQIDAASFIVIPPTTLGELTTGLLHVTSQNLTWDPTNTTSNTGARSVAWGLDGVSHDVNNRVGVFDVFGRTELTELSGINGSAIALTTNQNTYRMTVAGYDTSHVPAFEFLGAAGTASRPNAGKITIRAQDGGTDGNGGDLSLQSGDLSGAGSPGVIDIISQGAITLAGTPIEVQGQFKATGSGQSVANVGASSCGTTAATIAGGPVAFNVTVGATSGTQCRVGFTVAATTRRVCTASNESSAALVRASYVDTTHTDLLGTFGAGDVLAVICVAR